LYIYIKSLILNITTISFINKEEIIKFINVLEKDNELFDNFKNSEFSKNFKYLANGVFQAEGHIGGYFPKLKTLNFRPLVFIGITVNFESLKFLVLLNYEFNFKMKYSIEILPSNLYFVKLYSRD
jgi:hypothetical protein